LSYTVILWQEKLIENMSLVFQWRTVSLIQICLSSKNSPDAWVVYIFPKPLPKYSTLTECLTDTKLDRVSDKCLGLRKHSGLKYRRKANALK